MDLRQLVAQIDYYASGRGTEGRSDETKKLMKDASREMRSYVKKVRRMREFDDAVDKIMDAAEAS